MKYRKLAWLILALAVVGCVFTACERIPSPTENKIVITSSAKAGNAPTVGVYVYCDYTKHENYENWLDEYCLRNCNDWAKKNGVLYSKEQYFYFYCQEQLNLACQRATGDTFSHGKFLPRDGGMLYFKYTSMAEVEKDFAQMRELAKNDYIKSIVVQGDPISRELAASPNMRKIEMNPVPQSANFHGVEVSVIFLYENCNECREWLDAHYAESDEQSGKCVHCDGIDGELIYKSDYKLSFYYASMEKANEDHKSIAELANNDAVNQIVIRGSIFSEYLISSPIWEKFTWAPALGEWRTQDRGVYIYCDYSKHPQYDEWIETFGLKKEYENEEDKRLSGYYAKMNAAYYDTVKEAFSNGECDVDIWSYEEMIFVAYNTPEDLCKDFDSIVEMAKNNYVLEIAIEEGHMSFPT